MVKYDPRASNGPNHLGLYARQVLLASSDGGQGSLLKSFQNFRRKANSQDNKIAFPEFKEGALVQTSTSGHQLLSPPANWRPTFTSRTTQA